MFLYFRCTINVNDNFRRSMCPLNITFLHKFLYRITTLSKKNFVFTQKSQNKNDRNVSFSSNINEMEKKQLTLGKKKHINF